MMDKAANAGAFAAVSLLAFALPACMQAPDPSEALAGNWSEARAPAGQTTAFELDGSALTAAYADGRRFTATVDGGEAEVEGQPGLTVSVHSVPAFAFVQVYRRDGRPVQLETIALINRNRLMIVDERAGEQPRAVLAERR